MAFLTEGFRKNVAVAGISLASFLPLSFSSAVNAQDQVATATPASIVDPNKQVDQNIETLRGEVRELAAKQWGIIESVAKNTKEINEGLYRQDLIAFGETGARTKRTQREAPFTPQIPTVERPYHVLNYGADTKKADAARDPRVEAFFHGQDKIVVFNFTSKANADVHKFSTMQTELLQKFMTKLAAQSKKPFLLINISTEDYPETVNSALQTNTLSKNNTPISLTNLKSPVPPYGIIVGTSFEKGKEKQIAPFVDFALLNIAGNSVTDDELLNMSARSIASRLLTSVKGYNKLAAAELDPANTAASLTLTPQ